MEDENLKSQNTCFYSSFLFLINTTICWYYGYFIYASLFFALFVTSIIVHSYTNIYTILIDKISIISVVLYGGYVFLKKIREPGDIERCVGRQSEASGVYSEVCPTHGDHIEKLVHGVLIVYTFIVTLYLYYIGFLYNSYCFCENPIVANMWHSFLHLVSCIGHGMIVCL